LRNDPNSLSVRSNPGYYKQGEPAVFVDPSDPAVPAGPQRGPAAEPLALRLCVSVAKNSWRSLRPSLLVS